MTIRRFVEEIQDFWDHQNFRTGTQFFTPRGNFLAGFKIALILVLMVPGTKVRWRKIFRYFCVNNSAWYMLQCSTPTHYFSMFKVKSRACTATRGSTWKRGLVSGSQGGPAASSMLPSRRRGSDRGTVNVAFAPPRPADFLGASGNGARKLEFRLRRFRESSLHFCLWLMDALCSSSFFLLASRQR